MSATRPVTGNTKETQPENRAFYPALDGLRAIAFLLVFGNHYMWLPWGWSGVNFFFVLSGFLITGILYDTRDAPHRVWNFYMRRTLRIFPLYYAVLLALVLLWPLVHWQWNAKWLLWAAYLGNFSHFSPYVASSPGQRLADFQPFGTWHHQPFVLFLGHFWSLCIEEQFYLLWPWIVFTVRDRRKLLWICGLSLPVGLCLRLLAQHTLPQWMVAQHVLSRFTPLSCDALLVGGFVAMLLRGSMQQQVFRVANWVLLPYLAVMAAWCIWHHLRTTPVPLHLYKYPGWYETLGFTIMDTLGVLLILNVLQPGNWLYTVLNHRLLRWAGRVSYGAYVLHEIPHAFIGNLVIQHTNHAQLVTALIALVWTYTGAWLSFRFFEGPILQLKERWTLRT